MYEFTYLFFCNDKRCKHCIGLPATCSGKRKAALTKMRTLCKEILTGYEEAMAYGGPTYKKDNGI